jgi:hypothetical protein
MSARATNARRRAVGPVFAPSLSTKCANSPVLVFSDLEQNLEDPRAEQISSLVSVSGVMPCSTGPSDHLLASESTRDGNAWLTVSILVAHAACGLRRLGFLQRIQTLKSSPGMNMGAMK